MLTATDGYQNPDLTTSFPRYSIVSSLDPSAQSNTHEVNSDIPNYTDDERHNPNSPITNHLCYILYGEHEFTYLIKIMISSEYRLDYSLQSIENKSLLPNYKEINGKLTAIQSAFGVSAKQLAELLNVSLDDIFRWTRQEALPSDSTVSRLESLSEFAKIWNSHSKFPADDHFFEKNDEGHSLHDLLKDGSLNTDTITRNIKKTATQTEIFFAELKNNVASVANDSEGNEFDFWDLEAYRLPETNGQI